MSGISKFTLKLDAFRWKMEKGFRSSGGGGQQQEDAALADTAEQVGFLGHFGGHLKKLWDAT